MRMIGLLKESVFSGTIASIAMMPFGLFFRFVGLRIGHYGPKFAGLLFAEPNTFVLVVQHFLIGWLSTLPLLLILIGYRVVTPIAMGAAYGAGYYVVVNSLVLPLYFGDPLPWQLGLSYIFPSLLIHVIFGVSIAISAKKFVKLKQKIGLSTPSV